VEKDKFEHFEKHAKKAVKFDLRFEKIAQEADNRFKSSGMMSENTTLTIDYIFAQIEKVLNNTEHITSTLIALGNIKSGGSGDIANAERAEALAEIVQSREATNQKLLSIYEKMYDDLKSKKPVTLIFRL